MAVLISSVQHKQRADAVVIFPQPLSAAELGPHNSAEITSAEVQACFFFVGSYARPDWLLIFLAERILKLDIKVNQIY